MIDRIKSILEDYHGGLLDNSDDAARAILDTIRQPTESMCDLGDEVIASGHNASWVWRGMIDRARNC